MRSSRILPLLLFLLVLAAAPAEARFVDPAGEVEFTSDPVPPAPPTSSWSKLKSWTKEKIETVKAEARSRGWLPSEEERNEALAKKVQKEAGVEPVVTDELTAIAESYSPEQVAEATERVRSSSILTEQGKARPHGPELEASETGVPRYQVRVPAGEKVHLPRLNVGREPKLSRKDLKVPSFDMARITKDMSLKIHQDRELSAQDEKFLANMTLQAHRPIKTYEVEILTNKQIDDLKVRVAEIKAAIEPLAALELKEFNEFTQDDKDMLSALILIQNHNQCSAAVSLLHRLTKTDHAGEAYYHLSMCQKSLDLKSEAAFSAVEVMNRGQAEYVADVVGALGSDIAYEHLEAYSRGLLRSITQPALKIMEDPKRAADVAMVLTEYGAATGRYKLARDWGAKVPSAHPKYFQALYMKAVAEYALGSEKQSLSTQEKLMELLKASTDQDVRTLAAVNLGRLQFQSGKFQAAQKSLHAVDKNHPLWIQSLLEMGWSQLQYGDFAGAIGNMYSIHSPFFQYVYKPESYVVRTIGYLNLCQYADAYRTLSTLEKDYRPALAKIESYIKENRHAKNFYQTVRTYMRSKSTSDIDGLPPQVIREMARHKDFLNLQGAFNRNVDEKQKVQNLDGAIRRNMNRANHLISSTQERLARLDQELKSLGTAQSKSVRTELQVQAEIQSEQQRLASYKYILEIHKRTRTLLPSYARAASVRTARVLDRTRADIEKKLAARLYRMRDGLARILEANEFLRYEVFSGSGENIRFELAGGEKAGKRVPASVMPRSKELRWSFDGEYWADEIGHYRSSLKSNCPERN